MTQRTQSVSLKGRGMIIFAGVAWVLFASHPLLKAAPLSFRWPVPTRVVVTAFSASDTQTTVDHWAARLSKKPDSDQLELRYERPELWDITDGRGYRRDGAYAEYDSMLSIIGDSPPIMISTLGSFLGCSMLDEYMQARIVAIGRWKMGSEVDTTLLRRAVGLFWTPQAKAELEADCALEWNTWIGRWVGLDLSAGETTRARVPESWGEVHVVADVTVTNQGPTRPGGPWVRYSQGSVVEGEQARRAMERHRQRSTLPNAPRPDNAIQSARRTSVLNVVLDPASMLPNYAGNAVLIEYQDSQGAHTESSSSIYFFDWDPPLEQASSGDPIPIAGQMAFLENHLEDAYGILLDAAEEGSRNPDTYAYLAETCRRMGEWGQAVYFAGRALTLSPCHAFANDVLASCQQIHFNGWPFNDEESAWTHRLQSIACDSTDGNAWLHLHPEAKRRNRADLERRALVRLVETEFLPRSSLAYARWMVQDLPESTVLVTAGVMDTYPLWALQATTGLRPDVAVVNYPWLGFPWYARKARDELRVPLPFSDADLDSLAFAPGANPVVTGPKVLGEWLAGNDPGAYRRPVAIAITVDPSAYPPGLADRLALVGPVYRCGFDAEPSAIDTAAVRVSLSRVDARDFVGPVFSEADRDPLRRAGPRLSNAIVYVWLRYADRLADAGRMSESLDTIRRASEFAGATSAGPAMREAIETIRRRIQSRANAR